MSDGVFVMGGGGHAKVVVSTLLASGVPVDAIIDDDRNKWGMKILGFPIMGPQQFGDLRDRRGIIAVGDNRTRERLSRQVTGARWITAVHPWTCVHPSVAIGQGTVVFAGAVIQPDTIVGEHCIINSAATVDHDCVVGDFVHAAPGVKLAGGVFVGEGVFLGIGSVAIVGMKVGRWSVIGAGAVVVRDVPENVVAAGVPARVIKTPAG